jgi:glycerol-3-phosphate dehydrogenase (NAD(P)+)
MAKIGIIGAGAFGTALSAVMRRAGHDVTIWAREREVAAAINERIMNAIFLPGIALPPGIRATVDLAVAAKDMDVLLLAPPAQHMRAMAAEMRPFHETGTPLITCSKGIERGTCALMPQVIAETLPGAPLAVLSGPSFAHDIANGHPVGVSLACADLALGEQLAALIGSPRFRTYLTDDVTGVSLGGVLKNVIAIACGVAIGKKLGDSTRATLFARGLAEMMRLGIAMGARQETFMGLAGAGDLSLSCNSVGSRNTSLGVALGEGRSVHDVLRERITVQEGVHSAESVAALARRRDVDMPIATAVDSVLNHNGNIDEVIARLLARPYHFERVSGGVGGQV